MIIAMKRMLFTVPYFAIALVASLYAMIKEFAGQRGKSSHIGYS